MDAPISLEELIQYAQELASGDLDPLRSPSDFPDDIAETLRTLQEGAEFDESSRRDLSLAYQMWEDEDFLMEESDLPDSEDWNEGPPSLEAVLRDAEDPENTSGNYPPYLEDAIKSGLDVGPEAVRTDIERMYDHWKDSGYSDWSIGPGPGVRGPSDEEPEAELPPEPVTEPPADPPTAEPVS